MKILEVKHSVHLFFYHGFCVWCLITMWLHIFPTPILKGVEVNFDHLSEEEGAGAGRGESEKLEKGGGSIVHGKVFLKGGLAFFKVYHFYIYKLLYSAKLSYPFEENLFFSASIILLTKVILSSLKMNLKISNKLR